MLENSPDDRITIGRNVNTLLYLINVNLDDNDQKRLISTFYKFIKLNYKD